MGKQLLLLLSKIFSAKLDPTIINGGVIIPLKIMLNLGKGDGQF